MRLFRLLAYATLGYVLYELYLGMQAAGRMPRGGGGAYAGQGYGGGAGGGAETDELHDALNRDAGRMRMTGPGRGELLTSGDEGGTSVPHTVGRGVVQP